MKRTFTVVIQGLQKSTWGHTNPVITNLLLKKNVKTTASTTPESILFVTKQHPQHLLFPYRRSKLALSNMTCRLVTNFQIIIINI